MLDGLNPKSILETMLCTQMVSVHSGAMDAFARAQMAISCSLGGE
jgi:hypothetical protein